MIRLSGFLGWSKSSLGAHPFCWFWHEVAPIFILYALLCRNRTKTTKLMCAYRRLRSAWASAQSNRSSFGLMGSQGHNLSSCEKRRLWSDWADAKGNLSLRWVHMPVRWFCCEMVHIVNSADLIRLRECAGWYVSSLIAYVISMPIWKDSIMFLIKSVFLLTRHIFISNEQYPICCVVIKKVSFE